MGLISDDPELQMLQHEEEMEQDRIDTFNKVLERIKENPQAKEALIEALGLQPLQRGLDY